MCGDGRLFDIFRSAHTISRLFHDGGWGGKGGGQLRVYLYLFYVGRLFGCVRASEKSVGNATPGG